MEVKCCRRTKDLPYLTLQQTRSDCTTAMLSLVKSSHSCRSDPSPHIEVQSHHLRLINVASLSSLLIVPLGSPSFLQNSSVQQPFPPCLHIEPNCICFAPPHLECDLAQLQGTSTRNVTFSLTPASKYLRDTTVTRPKSTQMTCFPPKTH